jgi:hypothetical protein
MSVFSPQGGIIRPRSAIILPAGRPVFGSFALALVPPGTPIPERFVFDAVARQTHDRVVTAPKFPVELGLPISDHARREPDTLALDGVVSDTPISTPGLPGGALLGAGGNLTNRAHRELLILNEHFERREPVFVATSLRVYETMLILRFSFGREPRTGHAIDVSIMLEEVRIVSPLEVPQIEDLDGLIFGGDGTADLGTIG